VLWKLILALTLVPMVELLLLVRLTQLWGSFWLTVGVIIGTGLVGAVLARREGLRVLDRMRRQFERGELPTDSMLDGVLVLLAAALLVTPGLLTDAAGLSLLLPWTRAAVRNGLKRWLRRKLEAGSGFIWISTGQAPFVDVTPPDEGDKYP